MSQNFITGPLPDTNPVLVMGTSIFIETLYKGDRQPIHLPCGGDNTPPDIKLVFQEISSTNWYFDKYPG